MIYSLSTENTGPLSNAHADFGSRINLLTGDNGLGKTFLLDLIWFALTQQWPQDLNPALVAHGLARPTVVTRDAFFCAAYEGATSKETVAAVFDRNLDKWRFQEKSLPSSPGIVFYAMANGNFALWDPLRNRHVSRTGEIASWSDALVFTARQALHGLSNGSGGSICEGLIRDWSFWQDSKSQRAKFDLFCEVLKCLSSDPDHPLSPGEPTQLNPADGRRIPTIQTGFNTSVPITLAASGVRRVAVLAYLLLWCCLEHRSAAAARGIAPENCIVFLMDEVESHLHPHWQRTVLPSLLKAIELVGSQISGAPKVQLIVSTHAPLVMSSVEGFFHEATDCWFDFDFVHDHVELSRRRYHAQGNIENWLTSEAFDLASAYSIQAENVLAQAQHLLASEQATVEDFSAMTEKLQAVLHEDDPYWVIWNAEMFSRGIRS